VTNLYDDVVVLRVRSIAECGEVVGVIGAWASAAARGGTRGGRSRAIGQPTAPLLLAVGQSLSHHVTHGHTFSLHPVDGKSKLCANRKLLSNEQVRPTHYTCNAILELMPLK
jgi:hypothetical protein